MTHSMPERRLFLHVLKTSSVGCHAGLQSLEDGPNCSGKHSEEQLISFAVAIGLALNNSAMVLIFWSL